MEHKYRQLLQASQVPARKEAGVEQEVDYSLAAECLEQSKEVQAYCWAVMGQLQRELGLMERALERMHAKATQKEQWLGEQAEVIKEVLAKLAESQKYGAIARQQVEQLREERSRQSAAAKGLEMKAAQLENELRNSRKETAIYKQQVQTQLREKDSYIKYYEDLKKQLQDEILNLNIRLDESLNLSNSEAMNQQIENHQLKQQLDSLLAESKVIPVCSPIPPRSPPPNSPTPRATSKTTRTSWPTSSPKNSPASPHSSTSPGTPSSPSTPPTPSKSRRSSSTSTSKSSSTPSPKTRTTTSRPSKSRLNSNHSNSPRTRPIASSTRPSSSSTTRSKRTTPSSSNSKKPPGSSTTNSMNSMTNPLKTSTRSRTGIRRSTRNRSSTSSSR